jgi:plasmid stability protein
MKQVIIDIERPDVADALQARADAHGRSVAAEVAALVERIYAPPARGPRFVNWIDALIEVADGAELHVPKSRAFIRYAPSYPAGMEPLPGESFIDHIDRVSRPGVDLEVEEDRTPHMGPNL